MFFWIYDLPAFSVIILFEAVFVGVFWLGALLLRPFVRAWLHEEARLDDMLAGILQYFGVIFGLLLGLLAVATYQNRLDVEKSNADEASSLSASKPSLQCLRHRAKRKNYYTKTRCGSSTPSMNVEGRGFTA